MTLRVARGLALAVGVVAMISPVLAKDKKPVDPNKKICRSEVATGSVISKTTCHTAAEWAQIDTANGRNVDNFNDHRGRSGDVSGFN